MVKKIIILSRNKKQLLMVVFDVFALILALFSAFSMRLGEWFVPQNEITYLIYLAPVIALPVFIRFGLYRTVIRFMDFKVLSSILQAVSLYALLWGIAAFMVAAQGIPRSIIIINWALVLLAISASRLFVRWFFDAFGSNGKKVIIYGAGAAGRQLLVVLKNTNEYDPVAFIDDDKTLIKSFIGGLEVFNKNQLSNLIKSRNVEEVLLVIPSISNVRRKEILNFLKDFSVAVRILPGVSAIISGKINTESLQKVSINDLLGREKVKTNQALLGKNITDKVVCVTGAGGSIGSELCRQIVLLKPKILILYEINELALYNTEQELPVQNNIFPILGSVNNKVRMNRIFQNFKVETIYHTAAYKHVPMVEFNSTEGVNNNIFGTLHCAQAAIKSAVQTFVLISTDKAVRPTNTMGATKRCAELILQALAEQQNKTKFTMVRFGNVLGSSGSVVPLFEQQIKGGGPITVTDINIVRYFMAISEAVELVIQAGAMGLGGDVFVLDMGKPIRIVDLAKNMIFLSGLKLKDADNPDGDIEIKYSGLRLGEKLYEELLIDDNAIDTDSPLIMRAKENSLSWEVLQGILADLEEACQNCNYAKIRALLIQAVPDFKPQCGISDLLH